MLRGPDLGMTGSAAAGDAPISLWRIASLSALILFLEMLLIRWIGTEVRIFAYLQNGVLVAAFLGLGLGCRTAAARVRLLPAALALALAGVLIQDPFGWDVNEAVTQGLAAYQDSVVWSARGGGADRAARTALIVFSLLTTFVLLWAVVAVFRPLGQWLGRWMEGARPIAAYTVNIVGSLLGIALFDLMTLARTPPWAWWLPAAAGLALLGTIADESRATRSGAALLFLGLPMLAWTPSTTERVWSPYQKLEVQPWIGTTTSGRAVACGEQIQVNSTFYQGMVDLDPAREAAAPELYPPSEIRTSHYVLPYELIGARDRVLVVGAGSGNDVAAALRAGARSVHAVEIDPVIVEWGREKHPSRPYASDRVQVTIDDARAFFRRAQGPYDVIWFGLLDSHTTPSAFTNVRLDHFVYTRESFADVRRLLAPHGVVVVYFWSETSWIADRLVGLLHESFGTTPVTLFVRPSSGCLGHGGLLLIGGGEDVLAGIRRRAAADPEIAPMLATKDFPMKAELTTDDWPFLYLRHRSVPSYHLLVAAACLAVGLLLRRNLFQSGDSVQVPMLLLGAGFMLLEVSGVSRAALLFGTTWTVNAYMIAAILGMILLANLVTSRFPIDPRGWPFLGLFATLLALALVPTAWLASLPWIARVVLGGTFLSLPVFFSGLVFVGLWARSERRDLALGSNILGSLLGGIASMLSMQVGFQQLTFLTLAVYLAALLLARRQGVVAAPATG
jgi:SAM-dependent methyltransferase